MYYSAEENPIKKSPKSGAILIKSTEHARAVCVAEEALLPVFIIRRERVKKNAGAGAQYAPDDRESDEHDVRIPVVMYAVRYAVRYSF